MCAKETKNLHNINFLKVSPNLRYQAHAPKIGTSPLHRIAQS